VVNLLIAPFIHVGALGQVMSGDIFAGDPYTHRAHQSLSVEWVTVEINRAGPDGQRVDETLAQRLLYLTTYRLAFILATIPMLVLARRLIGQAMRGDPFTPAMVRRLRVLGAVVLVGGALSEAAQYAAADALLRISLPPELLPWAQPNVRITLWWIMPGLILLAIAEVVKRGVALRAELDGVI
jgi:hypothetical protein